MRTRYAAGEKMFLGLAYAGSSFYDDGVHVHMSSRMENANDCLIDLSLSPNKYFLEDF